MKKYTNSNGRKELALSKETVRSLEVKTGVQTGKLTVHPTICTILGNTKNTCYC